MPTSSPLHHEADKRYNVFTTATAKAPILEHARFIAVDQQSPQNAAEWLGRVWTCIDGLECLPKRFPQAKGYERLAYVVRRVILDNHLILFTIDEASTTVYVVGLRHGSRLPRPHELM